MWTLVRQGCNRCSVAVLQMRLGLGFDGTKKNKRRQKEQKRGQLSWIFSWPGLWHTRVHARVGRWHTVKSWGRGLGVDALLDSQEV